MTSTWLVYLLANILQMKNFLPGWITEQQAMLLVHRKLILYKFHLYRVYTVSNLTIQTGGNKAHLYSTDPISVPACLAPSYDATIVPIVDEIFR